MGIIRSIFIFLLLGSIIILSADPSLAARKQKKSRVIDDTYKKASLVIDAESGAILHQENAGAIRYPASLTKVMTLYLTFEALKKGKLDMDQELYVSEKAASQPRTNLELAEGDRITVREAILSLIVHSANDAAVVLAEAVSGSEWQFARAMTAKARKLGMDNTTFQNASGLHDAAQRTTAVDMAKLAVAVQRNFPEYYPLFSTTEFNFRGQSLTSHNRVTKNYDGAEGLKTGYVNASGFNLVTAAVKNGKRIVGVVLGGKSAPHRDHKMMALLDYGFSKLLNHYSKETELSQNEEEYYNEESTATSQGDISEEAIMEAIKPKVAPKPKKKYLSSKLTSRKTVKTVSNKPRPVFKPKAHQVSSR